MIYLEALFWKEIRISMSFPSIHVVRYTFDNLKQLHDESLEMRYFDPIWETEVVDHLKLELLETIYTKDAH